jgi:hypothetical protein
LGQGNAPEDWKTQAILLRRILRILFLVLRRVSSVDREPIDHQDATRDCLGLYLRDRSRGKRLHGLLIVERLGKVARPFGTLRNGACQVSN